MMMIASRSRSLRQRRRRLHLENLEERCVLSATILHESFKTLQYTATGGFSGQTRADIFSPSDYHDDYAGGLAFEGEVGFSTRSFGNGQGFGGGSGNGTENCPPQFGTNDNYAYEFDVQSSVELVGNTLQLDLSTTRFDYSNNTCTGNYTAGNTPFDRIFMGELDTSSIPYKATLTRQESGMTQTAAGLRPYRSNGTINVDVVPFAADEDGNPEPTNVTLDAFEHNGFVTVTVNVEGPTLATPALGIPVSQVDVYFASGPTGNDSLGEVLGSYSFYWNTDVATFQVQLPYDYPAEATHVLIVADASNGISESNEADNIIGIPIVQPGQFKAYSFTATVTQFSPGPNPEEAPNITVGGTFTGWFDYDRDTGLYGQLYIDYLLPDSSIGPVPFFDQMYVDDNGDAISEVFTLFYFASQADRVHDALDFQFDFDLAVSTASLPRSLEGSTGARLVISAENQFEQGFILHADIVITPEGSAENPGNAEMNLDEETSATLDVTANYAAYDIEIDPATILITAPPEYGSLSVNRTTGTISYTPAANYFGPDYFRYTVADMLGNSQPEAAVTISVNSVPEWYQNPAGAFFVNYDDLLTTALDLVLIVNALNATGPRTLFEPEPGTFIEVYFDVDGNNILANLDAALIIAKLNGGGGGEGEPAVDDQTATSIPAAEIAAAATVDSPVLANAEGRTLAPSSLEATTGSAVASTYFTDTAIALPLATPSRPLLYPPHFWYQAEESRPTSSRAAKAVDALLTLPDEWWLEW